MSTPKMNFFSKKFGWEGRTRTHSLLDQNQLLYQLSYFPMGVMSGIEPNHRAYETQARTTCITVAEREGFEPSVPILGTVP
jgi:hypothetical protein